MRVVLVKVVIVNKKKQLKSQLIIKRYESNPPFRAMNKKFVKILKKEVS